MVLDGLSRDSITQLNLGTGIPMVYRLNADSTVADAQIATEIEALRQRFPQTRELYREVCALLFFRYGITPTAKSINPWAPLRTLPLMLTERDRAVLEFEGSWWKYPEPKDRAIHEYLGITATRYYQVLRRLLDDPIAESIDPLTVRRLRRVRDEARERGVARRLPDGTPVG